ncbi:hypothetical protein BJX63DRAFT_374735 [Aspergillus granulosus]|uniref:Uncharacterized protein n=1 Tax=Aspergillus granulosus TaxID=176169 RepID=A0ABR4H0Y6_9EURO
MVLLLLPSSVYVKCTAVSNITASIFLDYIAPLLLARFSFLQTCRIHHLSID